MSAAVTSGYLLKKLCNLLEQPQGANLTIKELTACCARSVVVLFIDIFRLVCKIFVWKS